MPSIADLLFSMGEWLRTTPLVDFALWISRQKLSLALGSRFLVIPLLQTAHILAIATGFCSVLMVNLRVLGVSGHGLSIEQVTRRYAPWMWGAVTVLVATGTVLIIAEPVRELINSIFWVKMGLVVMLVLISVGFQSRLRKTAVRSETGEARRNGVQAAAIGLIGLWCIVIIAGRWIAYAPA